ncbi:hypothetical protein ACQ4WX_05445 [Streptomyces lasalocidi]
MLKMRTARRLGVMLVGAGAVTAALALPASAAGYAINQDVTCHVYEQVELQGSPAHDYMRFYTDGGSAGCWAGIRRDHNGTTGFIGDFPREITTNGSDASAWYYDGSGYQSQVVVWDRNGVEVDGTWH